MAKDEIVKYSVGVRCSRYYLHKNLYEIEAKLEKGQSLDLVREPDNKYDTFAIVIYNSNKEKLGYVPRR